MGTPYIQLITPKVGLSAGGQLVDLRGHKFRLRQAASIGARSGPNPELSPTVRVLFGDRVAPHAAVVSGNCVRVTTPRHPPSMWAYEFNSGRRVPAPPPNADPPPQIPDGASYVQISDGTVDVTIQNLDDNGAPIPGETFTFPDGFTFRRPRLDVPGTWELLLEGLANALVETVTPIVGFNPSLDYDTETGGLTSLTGLAGLPGIGLLSVNFQQSESTFQGQREVTVDDEAGVVALMRRPLKRDAVVDVVLVSNTPGELLSLCEVFDHVVAIGLQVFLPGEAPTDEPHRYDWIMPEGIVIPERVGRGELLVARTQLVAHEVTSFAPPGAPTDASLGMPDWIAGSAAQALTHKARFIRLRVVEKTDE